MTSETRRPMRADARRNYERLLASATEAFAEHGTDASLEDVARAAGVGIGTLYRHFPTREALLEAVLHDRFETLRTLAGELSDTLPPHQALTSWLREFALRATTYRGLPDSVMSTLRDEGSPLYASCHAMQAAGAQLLATAQNTGDVRADMDGVDVFTLAAALAWATEHLPDRLDRFLALLVDGLRPQGAR